MPADGTSSPELLLKKLRLPAHFPTSGLRTKTLVDPGACAMAGCTTSGARRSVAKKATTATRDGILWEFARLRKIRERQISWLLPAASGIVGGAPTKSSLNELTPVLPVAAPSIAVTLNNNQG